MKNCPVGPINWRIPSSERLIDRAPRAKNNKGAAVAAPVPINRSVEVVSDPNMALLPLG
jgi:hypothetical protein